MRQGKAIHRRDLVRVRGDRLRPSALAWGVALLASRALASGVVPDGGINAPTVTASASGHITVNVNTPVGGVSTNTYRDFNVSRAGVDLDNRAASARTILNQVTGTNPSVLEGPLAVLGSQHANVIIANPNGVSVNGLAVQNVGNLALTTGQVSPTDFTTANGQLQRNLRIDTGQGAIEIGPEGLSGALLNLELIAKQIRVGGPVTNQYDDPNARARLVAGTSHAEVDTSVSPTDNLHRWITYSTPAINPGQGIAIDITAAGSLMAGRIELMVTDQGAGVRHAGAAYATAGDFVVSGTGDLQLASGKIDAKQDVLIGSGGFTGSGEVSAGRHLQVTSDRVDLSKATLVAGTQVTGDLVIGADGQVHSQPVRLTDSTFNASGGIGVFDAGAGLVLTGTQLTANGNVVVSVPSLTTQAGGQRTTLTSKSGTVSVAAGEATLAGTDIDGVGGTGITARILTLQDTQGPVVRRRGGHRRQRCLRPAGQ
ncbi:filamentous hemagglutinin N-terminal domain-containing protein [Cupriavidus basilensis]